MSLRGVLQLQHLTQVYLQAVGWFAYWMMVENNATSAQSPKCTPTAAATSVHESPRSLNGIAGDGAALRLRRLRSLLISCGWSEVRAEVTLHRLANRPGPQWQSATCRAAAPIDRS